MTQQSDFTRSHETFWTRNGIGTQRVCTPGSQYLLRLLKGGGLGEFPAQARALDVGCGAGYDLVTYHLLGWQAFGVEISEPIAQHAQANAAHFGCQAEVRVGRNEDIPFGAAEFDFIHSGNSIHYISDYAVIGQAAAEFARVLRPGGRLVVLTAHPDNWMIKESPVVAPNVHRINMPDDYRHGFDYFVFPDRETLEAPFREGFQQIQVGVNSEFYLSKQVVNWVLVATRR